MPIPKLFIKVEEAGFPLYDLCGQTDIVDIVIRIGNKEYSGTLNAIKDSEGKTLQLFSK